MTTTSPGWYHGAGDPDGTERWWDGVQWVGAPRPIGGAAIPPLPPTTTLGGGPTPNSATSATFGYEPAGAGRRVGAVIIDGLISVVLAIPAIGNVLSQIDFDAVADGEQQTIKVSAATALLAFICQRAYHVIGIARFGTTLGKAAFGLRVVRASDGVTPPGFRSALLRHLPFLAAAAVSALGTNSITLNGSGASGNSGGGGLTLLLVLVTFVMVLSDSDRRRSLSDRVGKTYVVRKK